MIVLYFLWRSYSTWPMECRLSKMSLLNNISPAYDWDPSKTVLLPQRLHNYHQRQSSEIQQKFQQLNQFLSFGLNQGLPNLLHSMILLPHPSKYSTEKRTPKPATSKDIINMGSSTQHIGFGSSFSPLYTVLDANVQKRIYVSISNGLLL
jgi:hypothetical protein